MPRKSSLIALIAISLLLPVTGVLANERRDRALHYPVRAYNQKNFKSAILGFEDFISKFPNDAYTGRARRWLAYAYIQIGHEDNAYRVLEEQFSESPSSITFHDLAYLSNEIDMTDEASSLLSPTVMNQFPSLQKYKIAWLLREKKPQELEKILKNIPEQNRSEETRRFLNSRRNRGIIRNANKVLKGKWTDKVEQAFREHGVSDTKVREWTQKGAEYLWANSDMEGLIQFTSKIPTQYRTGKMNLYMAEAIVQVYQDDTRSYPDSFNKQPLSRARRLYNDLTDGPHANEALYGLAWLERQSGNSQKASEYLSKIQGSVDQLVPEGDATAKQLEVSGNYEPNITYSKIELPNKIRFNPVDEQRYFVIRGKVPVNGGKIVLTHNDNTLISNRISPDGSVSIGPIGKNIPSRVNVFLELKDENVVVIEEVNTFMYPVRVRLGQIKPRQYRDKTLSMSGIDVSDWKRRALKLFNNALTKNLGNRNLRIEFVEGLEQEKVLRDGHLVLVPK